MSTLRYNLIVKYNNREITVKTTKVFAGTWELKDFLKMMRELSGISNSTLHLKTDISPKRIERLEKGDIELTPEDVAVLQKVYKFPKKILNLMKIERPLWSKRLVELRSHHHFTQQELSEALNISQQAYAGYETGRSEPDIETLIKLADIYKVDLNYLMGRYTG